MSWFIINDSIGCRLNVNGICGAIGKPCSQENCTKRVHDPIPFISDTEENEKIKTAESWVKAAVDSLQLKYKMNDAEARRLILNVLGNGMLPDDGE
jgi:hypothetical protein